MRSRVLLIGLMVSVLVTAFVGPALAAGTVRINAQVGQKRDGTAANVDALRYVGKPTPAGYSHDYQWGTPRVTTPALEPDSGAVEFAGFLRLKNRKPGHTAMIGLLDLEHLETGGAARQRGAMIYVHAFASGTVRIGVTDGNAGGGELVQRSVYIPAGSVPDRVKVVFTVDGAANPSTCASSPSDVATAEGCMTLAIDGYGTVVDSYGSITANPSGSEFAGGGVPGWEAHPGGMTGIGFRLDVSPTT